MTPLFNKIIEMNVQLDESTFTFGVQKSLEQNCNNRLSSVTDELEYFAEDRRVFHYIYTDLFQFLFVVF